MVEEELISLESNSMNLEVRESEEVFEDDDLDPPCSKPAKKRKDQFLSNYKLIARGPV